MRNSEPLDYLAEDLTQVCLIPNVKLVKLHFLAEDLHHPTYAFCANDKSRLAHAHSKL